MADLDHILATTRTVRRQLDLQLPVPIDTITECLRLANQAPIASNQEKRSWVVVSKRSLRVAIADVYREVNEFQVKAALAQDATTRRVYESADYLASVLEDVPVLVIACLDGRSEGLDAGELAAFYGSIFPAIWSFQLALRARGLGSALTTAHLRQERRVAEILGIPNHVSQVALLPVAHSKQPDFSPANRVPVAATMCFETWSGRLSRPGVVG